MATHIVRISRVVADLDRAEEFYASALGFAAVGRGDLTPSIVHALDLRDVTAQTRTMRLGDEEIDLVAFTPSGRPCPAAGRSNDLSFQHLAIVVRDMAEAFAALNARRGWTAISGGGPQTLPPEAGSVKAFKFRDPDGHPLELIWFPPDQGRPVWRRRPSPSPFLGIDHTALSVSDGARSIAFYEALGFAVSAHSHNRGPAQARLDGLPDADLDVIALRPALGQGPGVELLAYRPPGRPTAKGLASDDITDWITLRRDEPQSTPAAIRDPDGHLIILTG